MKKILITILIYVVFISSVGTAFCAQNGAYMQGEFSAALVDITKLDILGLQQAVDRGKLTYKQIMTLYLERIEAYSKMYNCTISVSKTAIKEAEACDKIYCEKGRNSHIFGLPIIVKDNIDVKGMVTTNGSKRYAINVAQKDAEVVANLRAEGGIILAKANMDKFAEHSQYSISDYGRVNNAFDLSKTSYGSSGGCAVAAAASLAPICIGTDTNASIRVPASANGIVGIRPTKELLSSEGITVCMADRDVAGPMARTVQDAAIILSALDSSDTDYCRYLKENGLKGMRIGVVTALVYGSKEVKEYFNRSLDIIKKCGAEIVPMSIPVAKDWKCNVNAYRKTFMSAMQRYDVDAVVYPTIRSSVMSHTEALKSSGNSNGYLIAPAAGAPAMTVPMALDSSGMPVGIEFVGRVYAEADVITAGYAFEQALDIDIQTPIAPSLYEVPKGLIKLYGLKCQPVFEPFEHYDKGYEAVEAAYEEAVSYLGTEYYSDFEAADKAEGLIREYETTVSDYEDSYEIWKNKVILGIVIFGLIVIAATAAVIIIVTKRIKSRRTA